MEPRDRIVAYFTACGEGSAADIASHFTPDAVIYDTNLRPARGAEAIGAMWVKVRQRWGGATWHVDSFIGATESAGHPDPGPVGSQQVAAIEWSMYGTAPATGEAAPRPFVFRGSEHYRFAPDADDLLIAEIRQYWTFDPTTLDTGLVDYPYDGILRGRTGPT